MLKHFTNTVKSSSKSFIVCCLIFFVAVIFVLIYNPKNNNEGLLNNKEEKTVSKEEIIKLFDNIQDNYSLEIEENYDDKITNYEYERDSNIELLSTTNMNEGYILYKNAYYKVLEDGKISKLKNKYKLFDNYYMQYDFIKDLIKLCDFKFVNTTNASCNIKVNDFSAYINSKLNTTNNLTSDQSILVNVIYSNSVKAVLIDYTNYDKLVNNTEKLSYKIEFSNVGKNDFSEIIDHYKNVLEK